MDSDNDPDDPSIGLLDLHKSGWFKDDCLYPGMRITPDDIVLDLGCGEGGFASFAGWQGAHVIVADISSEKVAQAEARVRATRAKSVQAFVTDGVTLPLPDASVSRVICNDVLEHVPDPRAVMAELMRVTRPGAQLALNVPDPVSESLQQKVGPAFYFEPPNHVRIFSTEDFADLVTEAGLTIESHDRYGAYMTMFLAFFWLCKVDLFGGSHPLLDAWQQTWRTLIETPGGLEVKRNLDAMLPSSQVILARKPG